MDILNGAEAGMDDILKFRDEKDNRIREITGDRDTAVTIQVVSPGEVKNSEGYRRLLDLIYSEVMDTLRCIAGHGLTSEFLDMTGGMAHIVRIPGYNIPAEELKKALMHLEENAQWGRLSDLDVITESGNISRDTLGIPPRKCIICPEMAHLCARSRKHSMEDLLSEINNMYVKIFNQKNGNIFVNNNDKFE